LEKELAKNVITLLRQKNLTISVAESLTGGLVAKNLTDISGSSKVFKGGIVAYTDEIKTKTLKVDPALIQEFSSISKQVAQDMALKVRLLMNSDIGVSTTGIAGPEKSADFEPGTVFVAISIGEHNMCQDLHLTGDRNQIRQQSVIELLKLILSQGL
jgi:PncC family amidohydrolase